jgi:hypothetical protein
VLGWWISIQGGQIFDVVERAVQLEVLDVPRPGLGARSSADGVVTCDFAVDVQPRS